MLLVGSRVQAKAAERSSFGADHAILNGETKLTAPKRARGDAQQMQCTHMSCVLVRLIMIFVSQKPCERLKGFGFVADDFYDNQNRQCDDHAHD